jgi:hypothetical protein
MRAQLAFHCAFARSRSLPDRGECGVECVGRRLPVRPCRACRSTSARRPARRNGGRFRRGGRAADTRAKGPPSESSSADTPQEIQSSPASFAPGVERRRRGLGKPQEHRRRLDLEALAGGGLDLQRRCRCRRTVPAFRWPSSSKRRAFERFAAGGPLGPDYIARPLQAATASTASAILSKRRNEGVRCNSVSATSSK